MPNISASQARAELEQLFEPRTVFLAPQEPDVEVPRCMDGVIEADSAIHWDFEAFRWYRGTDINGVVRVFRFQRGRKLEDWHAELSKQKLHSVDGPFKSQQKAVSVKS